MNQLFASNPINAKRMLKNTGMLYIRHLFILFLNLFTVRLVLRALGTQDFGIYNVIAGIVLMCSFFCGTMATSSQRYFSIDLGRQDYAHLKQTFVLTLFIYVLLAVLFVGLAESVGLWFVNTKLTIPPDRIIATNWIYQTSIFAFIFTLMATPFLALVISHEDMQIYAYISVLEAILKLVIVFFLRIYSDKLISYGILMAGIALVNLSLYVGYCRRYYRETKVYWQWNWELFKEILSFSGWNLFGTVSTLIKNQGSNIFLNIFYGPLLNAAQSLAAQVRAAVSMFAANFSQAMRPQISKSYAIAKYKDMFRLVFLGSKIVYFLMLVMIVPLFYNVDYVLHLWLTDVPPYTVAFVRLLMLEALIESISQPMASVNQATGKIALYQGLIGTVVMLNLPVTYWILKWNYPVTYIYIAGCIFMGGVDLIRLIFLQRVQEFSYKTFMKQVLWPILCVTVPSFVISKMLLISHQTIPSLGVDLAIKAGISVLLVWLLGLNYSERHKAIALLKNYGKEYINAFKKFANRTKRTHC